MGLPHPVRNIESGSQQSGAASLINSSQRVSPLLNVAGTNNPRVEHCLRMLLIQSRPWIPEIKHSTHDRIQSLNGQYSPIYDFLSIENGKEWFFLP